MIFRPKNILQFEPKYKIVNLKKSREFEAWTPWENYLANRRLEKQKIGVKSIKNLGNFS